MSTSGRAGWMRSSSWSATRYALLTRFQITRKIDANSIPEPPALASTGPPYTCGAPARRGHEVC